MSFWKKFLGKPRQPSTPTLNKRYWNGGWNFGLQTPTDWEVLLENEPQLDNLSQLFIMPVRVAGPIALRGRPAVSVVAALVTDESDDLVAYMVRAERDLVGFFSDLEILTREETTLLGWPSAWMSYAYSGDSGPRFELNVTTFFGEGRQFWFQFLCETDHERAQYDLQLFRAIIASLDIGHNGFKLPHIRLDGVSACGLCGQSFGASQPHAMLSLPQGQLIGVCDVCHNRS